jgi:hypothetical protein
MGDLFVFPGIIFGLFYSLAGMAHLIEGKKGKEALIYSKELIKPYIIKYSDYLLAVIIIILFVTAVIIYVVDKLMIFLTSKNLYFFTNVADYFETLVIINAGIFFIVFLYLIYSQLRRLNQTA